MKLKILIAVLLVILLGIAIYDYYSKQDSLLVAARDGKAATTEELLKKSNWGIEDRDEKGRTPLILSAISGNAKITKMLVDAKADINAKDSSGLNATQMAIRFIRSDVIGVLVDAGADPNSSMPITGKNALMVAAQKRDKNLLEKLLKAKADINAKSKDGKTGLSYVLELGDEEMIAIFIDAGAKIDSAKSDETILSRIASNGQASVLRLLFNKGLVKQGVKGGLTEALGYVAADGHADLVDAILDTGEVDVNKPDSNGNTPLLIAIRGGKTVTISKLLAAKADINLSNKVGSNALMIVATNPNAEIVKLLLDGGIKVEATDLEGKTALMYLSSCRCSDSSKVAKMLLDAKVNVSAQDNDGWTALMYAARDGNKEVAEVLVKASPELGLKTKDGRTALAIAEQRKHQDIIALLRGEK